MVTTDTAEGIIDGLHFHYDVFADVLHLKLLADEAVETYADVTEGSDLLPCDQATDRAVGLSVVSWWKRFWRGSLPDSSRDLAAGVEPWAGKVAA
jgi:hypothetical protein